MTERQAGLEATVEDILEQDRCACYPGVDEIMLTFDAGGANAARSLRFKEDLIALSERLGVRLRIAHYPPYTSKWHPIEHRLSAKLRRSGAV